jgi:hypothetical protein
MNHLRIFLVCCIATILMISAGAALAGKDTPDIVMNTYKVGTPDTADLLAVSSEANSFVNRIASDKTYATKLLEAIQKNNVSAIVSIIKETAPRSTVQVLKINPDFTIAAEFQIRKYKVVVCASSELNCNGAHFLLTIT